MRIPLLGQSAEGISKDLSTQEMVNMYFEAPPAGEMNTGAAVPVHGVLLWTTIPGNPTIRAVLTERTFAVTYVVAGTTVYAVAAGGTVTSAVGTFLGSASGNTSMVYNPFSREILITPGDGEGYIYDLDANTLTQITDSDFPAGANHCAYIDGYFLVSTSANPGRFYWSNLNDGMTWDADSFATVESCSGDLAGMIVDKGKIYLWDLERGEIWYHTEDPDFIFQRFEYMEAGILSARTAKKFDNSVVWLTSTKEGILQVVRSGASYQPEILSTPALSAKWSTYENPSGVFAYTYQHQGHLFYVITWTSAVGGTGATFAYDASTGLWHQRSGAFSGGEPTRDYIIASTYNNGTNEQVFADYRANGRLYYLSNDPLWTFNGEAMPRRITGPTILMDNHARLRFSEIELDVENSTGDVVLSWSKDRGVAYSPGRTLDLASERVITRLAGMARQWSLRVYTATTSKFVVLGAWGRTHGEDFQGSGGGQRSARRGR